MKYGCKCCCGFLLAIQLLRVSLLYPEINELFIDWFQLFERERAAKKWRENEREINQAILAVSDVFAKIRFCVFGPMIDFFSLRRKSFMAAVYDFLFSCHSHGFI